MADAFLNDFSFAGLTPWDRELGLRQGRIAPIAGVAIGSLRVVAGSLLTEGDRIVLNDGVNPPTTLEYDSDGVFVDVPVPFTLAETEEASRDNMVAAINGVGSLNITASAGAGPLVTLANDNLGEQGNQPIVASVTSPNYVVNGMSGGTEPTVLSATEAAPEGEHVFVLGYDLPGMFHRFAVGDFSEVNQVADFGAAKLVRFLAQVRPTVDMPPSLAWRFSLRIDDNERAKIDLEPGRPRTLVDVAANVSKLSGDHALAFRVELVTS